MAKRLFAIVLFLFSVFLVTSCDYTEKMATFYVHNNSNYQITDIFVPSRSESGFREILEPNESCTMLSEWVDGKTISSEISFHMNGEDYGCREYEEAMTDTRRFKPYKRITEGDTITVKIYDDHWEW